jgi:transposase
MERRKFSREFKLEPVRLVRERGVAVAQAARDLDLIENVLRKWVREQSADPQRAFPVTLPPTSIQRDVDSGGCFGRSGRVERRGLVRSLASSAAPDPVAG